MPLSPVNSNTQMSVYMHNCIFIWNFFICFSILYFCVYLILLVSWQQIVLLDEQLKDVPGIPHESHLEIFTRATGGSNLLEEGRNTFLGVDIEDRLGQ